MEQQHAGIRGGDAVSPGAFPSVVFLSNGCTGVLVAEDVVVFAAHCGTEVDHIYLGDDISVIVDEETDSLVIDAASVERTVRTKSCGEYPDWQFTAGNDIAFCVLSERALEPELVIPPAMGCQRDAVDETTNVTIVGYGLDGPDLGSFGVKREATAAIESIGGEIRIGDSAVGSCAGDSGSPAFVTQPTLENPAQPVGWTLVGVLSSGIVGDACGAGYYVDLQSLMGWFEEETERDLTPCFDGDDWAPNERCMVTRLDERGVRTAEEPMPVTRCDSAPAERVQGCSLGKSREGGQKDGGMWPMGLLLGALLSSARRRATLRSA